MLFTQLQLHRVILSPSTCKTLIKLIQSRPGIFFFFFFFFFRILEPRRGGGGGGGKTFEGTEALTKRRMTRDLLHDY